MLHFGPISIKFCCAESDTRRLAVEGESSLYSGLKGQDL